MVEVWIKRAKQGGYVATATHDGVQYRGHFQWPPKWVSLENREALMHGWGICVIMTEADLVRLERAS